jgi:hypothetical protein
VPRDEKLGETGFEPAKALATGISDRPLWPLGHSPKSLSAIDTAIPPICDSKAVAKQGKRITDSPDSKTAKFSKYRDHLAAIMIVGQKKEVIPQ